MHPTMNQTTNLVRLGPGIHANRYWEILHTSLKKAPLYGLSMQKAIKPTNQSIPRMAKNPHEAAARNLFEYFTIFFIFSPFFI